MYYHSRNETFYGKLKSYLTGDETVLRCTILLVGLFFWNYVFYISRAIKCCILDRWIQEPKYVIWKHNGSANVKNGHSREWHFNNAYIQIWKLIELPQFLVLENIALNALWKCTIVKLWLSAGIGELGRQKKGELTTMEI